MSDNKKVSTFTQLAIIGAIIAGLIIVYLIMMEVKEFIEKNPDSAFWLLILLIFIFFIIGKFREFRKGD